MKFVKTIIALASPFAALLAGSQAFAQSSVANADCHVYVNKLQLVHGCIFVTGEGPGPCQSWEDRGPAYGETLQRTSPNQYELNDAVHGLQVKVVFNGSDKAQMSVQAPHVSQTKVVGVTYERADVDHKFPGADSVADYEDLSSWHGLSYHVGCSFGLSDVVDKQKAQDEAEMDRLGPPREWPDASAPSIEKLPIGTVLELTRDMDVRPGSGTELTKFVEKNGLMTPAGFNALTLQWRFAYAEFFDANNGYINPAHYPKGLRMAVTNVAVNTFYGGNRSYTLTLKTISVPAGSEMPADPIVRMDVTGRRAGASDVKIPQLTELLSPAMSVQLP